MSGILSLRRVLRYVEVSLESCHWVKFCVMSKSVWSPVIASSSALCRSQFVVPSLPRVLRYVEVSLVSCHCVEFCVMSKSAWSPVIGSSSA